MVKVIVFSNLKVRFRKLHSSNGQVGYGCFFVLIHTTYFIHIIHHCFVALLSKKLFSIHSPISVIFSLCFSKPVPLILIDVAEAENHNLVVSHKNREKPTTYLNALVQWDLALTHVRAHTRSPKQTKTGMGMFSAATSVASGNQWNGAH